MRAFWTALVAVALAAGACGGSAGTTSGGGKLASGPTCIKPENGSGCLDIAPPSKRVDLQRPSFTNPTSITNPRHSSSNIDQVIYGGWVDGKPFRTEFTRLAELKNIQWNGTTIPAVTWQYLAYSDGRIHEVALDWFAQADDGSVWYLGEDVFNYEQGKVADRHGTWIAGKEAPGALIMPASPRAGDVYRPENAPGIVFEEVSVKAVDQTVQGPRGPVTGAMTVTELHYDGSREDKVFAPGYGEFATGDPNGQNETVALVVPTDATPGPVPTTLDAVDRGAKTAFESVAASDWTGAAPAVTDLRSAWDTHMSSGGSPVLLKQMARDIDTLAATVTARDATAARNAVLRVRQNSLDLQLQYRPRADIEADRIALWERQLAVDAAAGDAAAVAGDKASLEWITRRL